MSDDPFEGLEDRLETILAVGAKLELVEERGLENDAIRRALAADEEAQRAIQRAEEGNVDENGLFRDDPAGRKAQAAFDEALDRQRAALLELEKALDAVIDEHGLDVEAELARRQDRMGARLLGGPTRRFSLVGWVRRRRSLRR